MILGLREYCASYMPKPYAFFGVSLTAIYDLIRPPNLARTSCNTWDSYPTKFVIAPIFAENRK